MSGDIFYFVCYCVETKLKNSRTFCLVLKDASILSPLENSTRISYFRNSPEPSWIACASRNLNASSIVENSLNCPYRGTTMILWIERLKRASKVILHQGCLGKRFPPNSKPQGEDQCHRA